MGWLIHPRNSLQSLTASAGSTVLAFLLHSSGPPMKGHCTSKTPAKLIRDPGATPGICLRFALHPLSKMKLYLVIKLAYYIIE